MVPDALFKRVPEIPDTPPGRYILNIRELSFGTALFLLSVALCHKHQQRKPNNLPTETMRCPKHLIFSLYRNTR